MATLTVRNLDEDVVRKLRIRAAEQGHSAEAEHRDILRRSLLERGEQVAGRQQAALRLAEFRRRTAGRGSSSSAVLLDEVRAGRTQTLAGPGEGV